MVSAFGWILRRRSRSRDLGMSCKLQGSVSNIPSPSPREFEILMMKAHREGPCWSCQKKVPRLSPSENPRLQPWRPNQGRCTPDYLLFACHIKSATFLQQIKSQAPIESFAAALIPSEVNGEICPHLHPPARLPALCSL